MQHFHVEFILLSAILGTCCAASQDTISGDLVNNKVQRNIDLATHLPKITTTITVENIGKSSVRSYLLAVDPSLKDDLSFIGAVVSIMHSKVTVSDDKPPNFTIYKAAKPKGQTMSLVKTY